MTDASRDCNDLTGESRRSNGFVSAPADGFLGGQLWFTWSKAEARLLESAWWFLMEALPEAGLVTFNPASKPLTTHW